MVKPLWGSDRNDYDALGLRALDDPHAAITRGQYDRARASDRELIAAIIERLGPDDSQRIYLMSPPELAILAHLERSDS
jgi:hypothetical protein